VKILIKIKTKIILTIIMTKMIRKLDKIAKTSKRKRQSNQFKNKVLKKKKMKISLSRLAPNKHNLIQQLL